MTTDEKKKRFYVLIHKSKGIKYAIEVFDREDKAMKRLSERYSLLRYCKCSEEVIITEYQYGVYIVYEQNNTVCEYKIKSYEF